MVRIFVSYSRTDISTTQELAGLLRKAYDEVWYDDRLTAGDDWWAEIVEQIESCEIFLFLASQEALASEFCQKELSKAQELEKHIIPVVIRNNTILPDHLANVQFIDMTDGISANKLNELYAALIRYASTAYLGVLSERQREADLRLLMKLWPHITSHNIEKLDNRTQNRQVPYDFYLNTISAYLRLRDLYTYPENHFCSSLLESAFGQFDHVFGQFHEKLISCYSGTRTSDSYILMADIEYLDHHATRPVSDDVLEFKLQEYWKTVKAVLEVRVQHAKLVRTIKTIMPEFDFDDHAPERE